MGAQTGFSRAALCGTELAALMFLLALTAGAQEYYWESSTGGEDSTGTVSMTSYSPGKMKFVSEKPADPELIVRLDRRSMLVVNTRLGNYAEVSFADWKNMRGQEGAWVVQIPAEIQQLPPEERDRKIQEYLASTTRGNARPEVIRVPETKTIEGFPCAKWIVKLENRTVLVVWTTKAIKEFPSMRDDLAEAFRQLSLNYPSMRYLPDALRTVDGFPLRYQAGDVTTTVKKIEKRDWSSDEFEAPRGYRKTTAALPGR